VSRDLAEHRAREIHDVNYDVRLAIPAGQAEPIVGHIAIAFVFEGEASAVVVDFTAPPENVHGVTVNGVPAEYSVQEGHIVIPRRSDQLLDGENVVGVDFTAGDGSLNRQSDFLYTLFVPDRASSAVPLFDQPDLKATFRLALQVPTDWEAVANAPVATADTTGSTKTIAFAPTRPLPTYLFAFVAGRFSVVTAERDGRTMQFYHRETDAARVARNLDAIFDLHATALKWLESYTGIPYPFDKVGFVAIPSFQYGGMEHPGTVLYQASSLFLDEAPTQNQLLGRASLIAHETAHMWFGDLVTMRWFNDVWMKEVFANFMAAKIVNPAFPDIDHELQFYLAHYPAAYGVDRTEGTNPIRQPLENLNEAGSLYGAIIYQKAPIVMRHLESLIGEEVMRDGLREYLLSAPYGNASWPDLISILDERTPEDLRAWSRVWVEESGRPTIETSIESGPDATIAHLTVTQSDPHRRNRQWPQDLTLLLEYGDSAHSVRVRMNRPTVDVTQAIGLPNPTFILAGSSGSAYGYFELDETAANALAERVPNLDRPLERAVGWTTAYEAMLYDRMPPSTFLRLLLRAVPLETDEQLFQRVLGLVSTTYWHFLTPDERDQASTRIESLLWSELARRQSTSAKAACYNTYVDVALSDEAVARLERLWNGGEEVPGVPLSEPRLTALAAELALRRVSNADSILSAQLDRLANPDRRARLRFVMPALSADRAVRDSVFRSFRDPANRERESWVLSALGYLNHPLRATSSEQYVMPSMELLEEIQRTGDIFFPLRWLDATLGGHNSPSVADSVVAFLNARPDYPPRLAGKLLQAADGVFRAARVVYGWNDGGAIERFGKEIVRE